MKSFIFIALGLLLFSCGGEQNKQTLDYASISIKVDTVMVDPEDKIINLRSGLWNSALTQDGSKLYLFDPQSCSLDIIDLNQLILEKRIPFEKEGPNGTGSYVTWMSILDEERIFLANFSEIGLFDLQGNKLRSYTFTQENFDKLEEGTNFYRKALASHDGTILWGMLGSMIREEEVFTKVDFEEKRIEEIALPGKELLQDYPLKISTENMNGVMPAVKTLSRAENRLILANSAYANLFVIDINTDSAYQIDYNPKLTAKSKKGGYPSEVDSEQRFREVAEQIHAEINFIAPIWDAQQKKFYRFSFETSPTGVYDGPLFKMPENRPIAAVYLSIFDENLNLIGETLTDLKVAPIYSFVKDGVIWVYVNVDDEMGFVRFHVN
ncbi:MAG: DUF4221 family protein [Mongoliitalea sp.]